jgi:hypothetical protein
LEKQDVRRVRRKRRMRKMKRMQWNQTALQRKIPVERKEHGGRDIKMLEPGEPIVRLFPAELTLPLNRVYPEVVRA